LAANKDYEGAVAAYDDIIAKFPEGDRKGDALFMQAFIYQNDMADIASAEAKYLDFIRKYPNHEMADDARFAAENLSLSDEELYNKIIQLQIDGLLLDSL
jgi:TolA-binding protein